MDQAEPESSQTGQQRSVLTPLDAKLAELRAASPGWRIWYVPTFTGSQMTVTWCAHPLPVLNCGSPEELTDEMRAADAWRAGQPQAGAVAQDSESGAVISGDSGHGPVARLRPRT